MDPYILLIDMQKPDRRQTVTVKQGTSGSMRPIDLVVMDGSHKYDMSSITTATIHAIKPDKSVAVIDCDILKDADGKNRNVIEYLMSTTVQGVAGQVVCECILMNDLSAVAASFDFYIVVENMLLNEQDLLSKDDLTGFRTYMTRAEHAASEVESVVSNFSIGYGLAIQAIQDIQKQKDEIESYTNELKEKEQAGYFTGAEGPQGENGRDGVITDFSFLYGFAIEGEDLVAYYNGPEAPPLYMDDKGELIYTLDDEEDAHSYGRVRGSYCWSGDKVTGQSRTPAVFDTGLEQVYEGDYYLNVSGYNPSLGGSRGNVYRCAKGGNAETATWFYVGSVLGPVSDLTEYRQEVSKIVSDLEDHKADQTNPHGVTKEQVGLGNVENTSDAEKVVASAGKLTKGATISVSGAATGLPALFDGTKAIEVPVTSLDATKLKGIINLDNLPKGSLERVIPVKDDEARFALTTDNVQEGDTVKVVSTGLMYLVVDSTKLSSDDGYIVYTAESASSVPWSGVTGKPDSMPASDVSDWAKADEKPSYTWDEINDKPTEFTPAAHVHDAFTGASEYVAGEAGFVPRPKAGEQNRYLRADGTWSELESEVIKTKVDEAWSADTAKSVDWSNVANRPEALPASDVSAWAKKDTLSNAINSDLTVGTSDPGDDDYYIAQYSNGGDTTTTYHRRKHSALWNYIKGKISSVLGLTNANYSGKAATSGTADRANSVAWENTGHPAAFPPSAHTHDDRYYTESEVDTKLSGKQNSGYYATAQELSGTVDELYTGRRETSGGVGSISLKKKSSGVGSEIPAGWYNYFYAPHRMGTISGDNSQYATVILTPMNFVGTSYILRYSSGSLADCKPILTSHQSLSGYLTTSGTAASANKLANARRITIGATGKNFDGTGNVSWSYSEIGGDAFLRTSPTHGIPNNADLNTLDYLTVGTYLSASGSNTFKNSGINGAWMMIVIAPLGGDDPPRSRAQMTSSSWCYRLRYQLQYSTGRIYVQAVSSDGNANFSYGGWSEIPFVGDYSEASDAEAQGCITGVF